MSLIPTIYRSSDPGAPALSGQPGALVALLDAVLVNGYGSGLDAKPPLGWSIEFSDANIRCYRNSPLLGSGRFLRVDDTATVGNARHAWLRGFVSMSGISTGIEPFPTEAQRANGSLWPKSSSLDGVSRAWTIIGNARCFYLFVEFMGGDGTLGSPHFAGDIDSLVVGDMYGFALSCSPLTSFTGTTPENHSTTFTIANSSNFSTTLNGFVQGVAGVIARPLSHEVGAERIMLTTEATGGIFSAAVGSVGPYPALANAGLLARPLVVKDASTGWGIRGFFPGVLAPLHDRPFADSEIIPALHALGGSRALVKSFRAPSMISNTGYNGQVLFLLDKEWSQ